MLDRLGRWEGKEDAVGTPVIDVTKSLVERSGVWSPGVGVGVHQLSVS